MATVKINKLIPVMLCFFAMGFVMIRLHLKVMAIGIK